jgi:hypothetical protein
MKRTRAMKALLVSIALLAAFAGGCIDESDDGAWEADLAASEDISPVDPNDDPCAFCGDLYLDCLAEGLPEEGCRHARQICINHCVRQ